MQNPLKILQDLIQQKREKIVELFNGQNLHTEFEYELILTQLDFRYDNEASWTEYEKTIAIMNELLQESDANIIRITSQIESLSFQISNI